MFSQAKLDGVDIMALPDAPEKEVPQLSDEQAVVEFQAHQADLEKRKSQEDQAIVKTAVAIPQDESIVSMAAEYAQTLAMEQTPAPKEETPNEVQQQAQAALDEVKIVIPDGM